MAKPGFLISAPMGERKAAVELAQELARRESAHISCPHDYSPMLNVKHSVPPRMTP